MVIVVVIPIKKKKEGLGIARVLLVIFMVT
jgi:hypothetical protein